MPITRRELIKTSGLCFGGALVADTAFAGTQAGLAGRHVYELNQGWRWGRDVQAGMEQPAFEDAAWETVTLPHTVSFVPWHNIDQQGFAFISTYRKHFTVPQPLAGRRVFLDFEGVMTASKVWCNGTMLGEYFGGFTPFSFELTDTLPPSGEALVCVQVDSRELPEVPPFGYEIDYLTYGGTYRNVKLRVTGRSLLEAVQVRCLGVLTAQPTIVVDARLIGSARQPALRRVVVEAILLGGTRPLARVQHDVMGQPQEVQPVSMTLQAPAELVLWGLKTPKLYRMNVRLLAEGELLDEVTCTFGVRDGRFTPEGFSLNGEVIKLRGLNRHQTFPFAGAAMPARMQRRDAFLLKHVLKCNVVRCSHYPQSPDFLDACDELGLLVIDETPGWQHVGESVLWQERYLDNTRRMVERDGNHPSVVLWSVRVNESRDFHELYLRVNQMVHALDETRQTTGVRYFQESELLEDVFSMNDFTFPLKQPNHPLYLSTEFVGAEFPVRSSANNAQHREHILRYARIYDQIASNPGYAGGLGWCAFDYQTHSDFGSGDHICYHGVMDIFRQPKPAAGFSDHRATLPKSQCSRRASTSQRTMSLEV